MTARAALLLAVGTVAFAPAGRSRVASGTWAGEHVHLEVSGAGARVEFDCAHGTIDEPMVLDRRGRFDLRGTYVREHGGPVRADEPPGGAPARYAGRARGRTMTLTVVLTGAGERIGSFALVRGAATRLHKCR